MSNLPPGSPGSSVLTPPVLGRAGALMLTIVVSCELMLMLDGTIVNVALPVIRDDLGFSAAGLSWVVNAFLLAFGGLLLLGGRAGDVLGHRRVFLSGIALFTAASLLGGLATAEYWLVAMRALQGVGAALAGPSTLALLVAGFTGAAQAKALGIYSSVTALAMTLGLVLGGVITDLLSWRWALFVNVPIGLAVLLLAPRYIARSPRHQGRFDVLGAVTSAAGMTGIVFGLARIPDHGWSDVVSLAAMGVGVVLLAVFVLVERAAEQPIMPLGLFADRSRTGAYLSFLLVPMVTLSMQFLLVQFFQEVAGYSPLVAGLAFLPMAAGLMAAARFAPTPLARFGARTTAAAGVLLILLAVAWLTRISAETGYVEGIAGPLLLAGTGLGLTIVPLNVTIMATIDPRDSGAGAGLLQALMMSGASLGVAVLSAVYASGPDGSPHTADAIAGGMSDAFQVGLGFTAAALLVVLFVIRPAKTATAEPAEACAATGDPAGSPPAK